MLPNNRLINKAWNPQAYQITHNTSNNITTAHANNDILPKRRGLRNGENDPSTFSL